MNKTKNETAEMLRIQAHAYVNHKTKRVRIMQAVVEIIGESTPPRLRDITKKELRELNEWLARIWK